MAKTTKTETVVENTENLLNEFITHQRTAAVEAGKAVMALFPEKVREHGNVAIEEVVTGIEILSRAVVDEAEKTVKTTRSRVEGLRGGLNEQAEDVRERAESLLEKVIPIKKEANEAEPVSEI